MYSQNRRLLKFNWGKVTLTENQLKCLKEPVKNLEVGPKNEKILFIFDKFIEYIYLGVYIIQNMPQLQRSPMKIWK